MASSSGRAPPADTAESGDDDDLPPPYTPSPNVRLGEETIGFGPQRPFQQPHPHPYPHHHQSSPYSHPPPPPAQQYQPAPTGLAPWQTQQQYYQRPSGGGGLIGSLIDTFRDIADVVTGTHEDERWVVLHGANSAAYATPGPHPSASPMYAPPPGPQGQPHHPPPLPPRRPVSTPPGAPPTMPDDGTPTRTPVPGHPLLRDGHLLVYPRNHLCDKCFNTGYKNYDPSHPCRKCWEKYSKSYTGAITYTTWSSSGSDPRMQRPLPKFVPPQLSGHGPRLTSGSVYAPPPQQLSHSRSVSQPHTQGSSSYCAVSPLSSSDMTPPGPHAITVTPGDPRMGGQLCLRCGGEGVQTSFLFDETTCSYCGGAGRVWT